MSAYVRVVRSIWTDPEWLDLTSTQKLVYLQLISQPNVSKCGVLPFVPRRWAHMHPDLSADDLIGALSALEAKRYVVIDRDTEEILIRTYLRYDEAWKQTNGTRGIQIEAQEIMSKRLLDAVIEEYEQASGNPWDKGNDKACANPCDEGNDKACATPLSLSPYPLAPIPEPITQNTQPKTLVSDMPSDCTAVALVEIINDDDFSHFWAKYPRRTQKANALRSWSKLKPHDRIEALARLPEHVAWWQQSRTEPQFVPHPATWINQRRWEDQLPDLTPPGIGMSRAAQTIQEMMRNATDGRSQDRGLPRRSVSGMD
jgi:hypothetical protein